MSRFFPYLQNGFVGVLRLHELLVVLEDIGEEVPPVIARKLHGVRLLVVALAEHQLKLLDVGRHVAGDRCDGHDVGVGPRVGGLHRGGVQGGDPGIGRTHGQDAFVLALP